MPKPELCPDCKLPLNRIGQFQWHDACPADPAEQRRALVASGWTEQEAADAPLAVFVEPGTVDFDPDAAAGK